MHVAEWAKNQCIRNSLRSIALFHPASSLYGKFAENEIIYFFSRSPSFFLFLPLSLPLPFALSEKEKAYSYIARDKCRKRKLKNFQHSNTKNLFIRVWQIYYRKKSWKQTPRWSQRSKNNRDCLFKRFCIFVFFSYTCFISRCSCRYRRHFYCRYV